MVGGAGDGGPTHLLAMAKFWSRQSVTPLGVHFLARLTPRGTLYAILRYLMYGDCMKGVQFFGKAELYEGGTVQV